MRLPSGIPGNRIRRAAHSGTTLCSQLYGSVLNRRKRSGKNMFRIFILSWTCTCQREILSRSAAGCWQEHAHFRCWPCLASSRILQTLSSALALRIVVMLSFEKRRQRNAKCRASAIRTRGHVFRNSTPSTWHRRSFSFCLRFLKSTFTPEDKFVWKNRWRTRSAVALAPGWVLFQLTQNVE